MGDRSFSEFFEKLALRMDGLFVLKEKVVMGNGREKAE